jgi:hypothetical protein
MATLPAGVLIVLAVVLIAWAIDAIDNHRRRYRP